MQHELERRTWPGGRDALADRQLGNKQADGEKSAGTSRRRQQRGKFLDRHRHLDAQGHQHHGKRDRPDQRAARDAAEGLEDAAAARIGRQLEADDRHCEGKKVRRDRGQRGGQHSALAVGDGDQRDTQEASVRERAVQAAQDALGTVASLHAARKEVTDQRGGEGGDDHRREEIAAQDLLERAAVDGDEEHRRQSEGVHELVERFAGGLRHQTEAASEQTAGHQPEDRQHGTEYGS